MPTQNLLCGLVDNYNLKMVCFGEGPIGMYKKAFPDNVATVWCADFLGCKTHDHVS